MAGKRVEQNFTEGPILVPLLRFAVPVLLALILQAMYGAVDLLVVGQFATSADVSAVSTGSQLMHTITNMIAGLAMGTTILLGQQIGRGEKEDGGKTIGTSICLFFLVGCVITVVLTVWSGELAMLMHAPKEAYSRTVGYIRICGAGSLIIIFYNLIGSVFRGMGDSTTPLITVAVACVCNIAGDLFFVAGLGMGTNGAAIATVLAQAVSVVSSLILIRRKTLPFTFGRRDLRLHRLLARSVLIFGAPVALQELLVGMSFLVIYSVVNSLGLIASAGVGVGGKVCAFIMLVPSSFMQSLAAFVAQNFGARKYARAYRTLRIAILLSLLAGCIMSYLAFFQGHILAGFFSHEPEVIAAAADYLKAYAIDCLLTAFLFCFVGFYNGIGMTRFVMLQGICGAFGVRVPLSILFSRMRPVSLFRIGLATPSSSVVQILLCLGCLLYARKKILVMREPEVVSKSE